MSPSDIGHALAFLQSAECLKDALRSSNSRPESTAALRTLIGEETRDRVADQSGNP
jgi:hypothetical protein